MKELAKASDAEKPLSQDKKHSAAEITDLFIPTDHSYTFPVFFPVVKPVLNYSYISRNYTSATGAILRPPIFIA
jgi:hypothetical protein